MSLLGKIARKVLRLVKKREMIPIPFPVNTNTLLEGKVALITGGSGGIGMAIAEAFIMSGAKVIIAGTNEEKLKECLRKLPNRGGTKSIVLDVLQVSSMPGKVIEAAGLFPENKIDILVNSAGVHSRTSFGDTPEHDYDASMNVNVKGTYFMSQAVSKFMIEHKTKGHILNLSSASALRTARTPYQVSKWAIRGLTLGMADALLPHGIIVNAIAPGPTATPMLGIHEGDSIHKPGNPSGRYAMPSEIANLAVFMASSMGDLIVGDSFYITGGGGTISLHR